MKFELLNQLPSGQWPTLMVNIGEKKTKIVDSLATTIMVVYLTQMRDRSLSQSIDRALGYILSKRYIHEIEGFPVWHFNAFYPPDWEDTAMAVYVLVRNGRLSVNQLEPLRKLLIQNTSDLGTGVWIKDPYSKGNGRNNHWDPTTALNVLRLHCLLETDSVVRVRLEKFIIDVLNLENFFRMTLYYTPPLAVFFGRQLLKDFPILQSSLGSTIETFGEDVVSAIINGNISVTPFEKALLGIEDNLPKHDPGLMFHHGKRFNIWYGSPLLYQLAC